jgi:hypothetical protein
LVYADDVNILGDDNVACSVGNTSSNLRILDLMPDLLDIRQAELQLIITIAILL